MDWDKEKEKVGKSAYLQLEAGSHQVLFLDEGNEIEKNFPREDGKGQQKKQVVEFNVEYLKEKYLFSVTKTYGLTSAYGQLCILGGKHGSLAGKMLSVLVAGKGKQKQYTFPEALEEQQRQKVVSEDVVG